MRGMEQQIIWAFMALSGIALFLYFSRKNLQENLARQKLVAKEQIDLLRKAETNLREKVAAIDELKFHQRALQSIIDEKSQFFPWLLAAKTEYGDVLARRDATFLERKRHPAVKASEDVKKYRLEAHKLEILNHRLIYREKYLEKLFPWLSDFLDEDISELVDAADDALTSIKSDGDKLDPALEFLPSAEYQKLPEVERNQLALERYLKSRKTKWQVGREFERYVGYSLEEDDYKVSYDGAVEGFSDLGRDLVATKMQETLIVQCKYWREDRTIHEKHIYQLYGTFCDYVISKNLHLGARQGQLFGERDALQNVKPVFLTTGTLSPRAKLACQLLGVEAPEMKMEKLIYPAVKCNISQRGESKIYHLPFDQQYDRVRIDKFRGECFVATCQEAEKLGFRRAWRWSGDEN